MTVMTFVATVQVTAEPSDRFSNAAPLTVVRSFSGIVLSVLTVSSNADDLLRGGGVMMACLFDVTVSARNSCHFLLFLLTCFCQSPLCRCRDREYA